MSGNDDVSVSLRKLLGVMRNAVFSVSGGCLAYVNKSFLTLLGYDQEDLADIDEKGLVRLVHPKDRDVFWAVTTKQGKGPSGVMTMRFRHKDGHIIYTKTDYFYTDKSDSQPDVTFILTDTTCLTDRLERLPGMLVECNMFQDEFEKDAPILSHKLKKIPKDVTQIVERDFEFLNDRISLFPTYMNAGAKYVFNYRFPSDKDISVSNLCDTAMCADMFAREIMSVLKLKEITTTIQMPDESGFVTDKEAHILLIDEKFPYKVRICIRDVSETRKRLQQEEERYKSIITDLACMVLVLTPDFKIKFTNKSFADSVGRTIDNVIGESLFQFYTKMQSGKIQDKLESLNVDFPSTIHPETFLTKRERPQDWTFRARYYHGKLVEYIAIGVDITRINKLREERAELQSRLKATKFSVSSSGDLEREFNDTCQILTMLSESIMSMINRGTELKSDKIAHLLSKCVGQMRRGKKLLQQGTIENFHGKGENILVIDDEQVLGEATIEILTESNYKVTYATTGEEGLTEMEAHSPDLVILDWFMPGMTGQDFMTRALKIMPDVKVIMSSADPNAKAISHEYSNVRGFLPKPYPSFDLLREMSRVLAQKS